MTSSAFELQLPVVDDFSVVELDRVVLWLEPRPKRWNEDTRLYNVVVIRSDGTLGQCILTAKFLATRLWI